MNRKARRANQANRTRFIVKWADEAMITRFQICETAAEASQLASSIFGECEKNGTRPALEIHPMTLGAFGAYIKATYGESKLQFVCQG